MKEYRREQHYAVSPNGLLTEINDAQKSNEDFFCPHCGCKMLKKCGKIRRWHFAHDWRNATEEQKNCTYESYLHAYAKIRFKDWFENSEQIIVAYSQTLICSNYNICKWKDFRKEDQCKKEETKRFNIKEKLNKCAVEKEVNINGNRFRPDLLWYNENNPQTCIFIEIKVTHECTDKKKDSNNRIIEFDICSEEDVERIISDDITESDTVHFYGFKTEKVIDKKQFNPIDLYKFQLFESGKGRISLWNCHNASYRKKPTIFEVTAIAHRELDRPKFYTSSIAKAHKLGYPVLNCLLCKYRTRNDDGTPYCEKTGMVVKVESEAINCPNYLYDEKRRNRFIESYKQFEYLGLNLWERNPNHKIIKFCK